MIRVFFLIHLVNTKLMIIIKITYIVVIVLQRTSVNMDVKIFPKLKKIVPQL